ncbi:MAG: hypothetical protein ABT940_10310 [Alphaproteobacteria bacterium]
MEIASRVGAVSATIATPVVVEKVERAPVPQNEPSLMTNYLNFAAPAYKVQPEDGTVFMVMRDAVTGRVHDTVVPPAVVAQYQQSSERIAPAPAQPPQSRESGAAGAGEAGRREAAQDGPRAASANSVAPFAPARDGGGGREGTTSAGARVESFSGQSGRVKVSLLA